MKIGLGMDTGGTYTDSVLMDLDSGTVLGKAKSMTTREDLSIGIRGSLDLLDRDILKDVSVVVLSSTLATNSVVEGKGCRVGLICIGGEYNNDVPVEHMARVAGGHDIFGDEEEPLDVEAVRSFLGSLRGKVDGLAVSGYMSVRNPTHETRVRTLAREILGVPVVCGHELSTSLGFSERTTTCIMNSRLIPIIDELIRSVEKVLSDLGIRAPLMIFRGNGSIMSCDVARERPVETILSGPAASLMGAKHMTGVGDAVVMDIGGTTTDIGILRGGSPSLEPEGATIGGKKTRVMAAKVVTSGLGGDSRIAVDCGRIVLMPQRVVPLCVAAVKWPEIASHVELITRVPTRPSMKPINPVYRSFDIEFLRTLRLPSPEDGVPEADRQLLEHLSKGPSTLKWAAMALNRREADFDVPKLISYGYLQRIGLTPTDILHVGGIYTEFDVETSRRAVAHMAGLAGMDPEAFVDRTKRIIRNRLASEVMNMILEEDAGTSELGPAGTDLVMRAITMTPGKDFHCTVGLNKPIIGIGASSGVYIRWLSEVFGTDVLIAEDSDVGNAVGAITASVSETVEVLVRPLVKMGRSGYEAFSKSGRVRYETIEEAIEDAMVRARVTATEQAARSGAEDVFLTEECDRHEYIRLGGKVLDEAVIRVTATGKPRSF